MGQKCCTICLFANKKRTHGLTQVLYLQAIAGAGFEPATSGLWARRATRLLYPAVISCISYKITQNFILIKRKMQKSQIPSNLSGNFLNLSLLVFISRPAVKDTIAGIARNYMKMQMLNELACRPAIIT